MNPLKRHHLKKMAAITGVRGRRRRASMEDFCKHLRALGFEPASIVDVGVAHGTFEIYTIFPNARYLLVEPMEEFRPAVDWIVNNYSASVEWVAAGAENGSCNIAFSGPSLSEMHGASVVSAQPAETLQNVRVIPMKRLDAMISAHNLDGPKLIKVDTQGTEHAVIEGASGVWADVEVVILEVSLFDFAQGQPTIGQTLQFMADRDFVPYDIFGGHNRPLDGALAQVDIAFVREDGRFRKDRRYTSFSAAQHKRSGIEQLVRKLFDR